MTSRNVHGRGLLQLEDRDAGGDELLERGGNVLVLDRLVADVEDDAEMTAQRHVRLGDRDARELRRASSPRRPSRDAR